MTRRQFENIKGLLEEWRAVRNLSVEDQKKNFNVNYTKELLEYFEAQRANNEYEMIDALCDMIVIAINAGHTLGMEDEEFYNDESTEFKITSPFIYEDNLHLIALEIKQMGYNPYLCLIETIKELHSRQGEWNEKKGKWCKYVGAYTKEEAIEKSKVENVVAVYESADDWLIEGAEQRVEICKWYKADYSQCKNA